MPLFLRRAALTCALVLATPLFPAFAQDETRGTGEFIASAQHSDAYQRGVLAYRDGRLQEAVSAFQEALRQNPGLADAHYQLARLYGTTELDDYKQAQKYLDAALALEPNNIQYQVALLQHLRSESWLALVNRVREQKRLRLARDILRQDPDNGYAHEEMGVHYIWDFWRYRNAIMMPTLTLAQATLPSNIVDEGALSTSLSRDEIGAELDPVGDGQETVDAPTIRMPEIDPLLVYANEAFDFETLAMQGVPIQDLSVRGQRAYDRAKRHLDKALDSDPRRLPVYEHLMEIYALKGEWNDALATLGQMVQYFPEAPETWMYLGLAHFRAGNGDAANVSFERALSYFEEGERAAFQDLSFILPDDEKSKYEANPGEYAARFWASQDPRFLTPYNERRLEHYARLVTVDLLYDSDRLGRRGWESERGQIYLRYGKPTTEVTYIPSATGFKGLDLARELAPQAGEHSDTEDRASSSQIDRYIDRNGTNIDMLSEANTFIIWQYDDGMKFIFEDPFRAGEYRFYSPSAVELADGVDAWRYDYTILARETMRETPERYTYVAPGARIDLPYLVSTFRSPEPGVSDLYVHFGVPVTSFDPEQPMVEVTANVGTYLIADDYDILVERQRTIYGLPTNQIVQYQDANLWVDSQTLRAPAGQHDLSIEFETASGQTVAMQRREVTVPAYEPGTFAVSDMVLAFNVEEGANGEALGGADIVRGDLSITPAPWSVFRRDRPIYLYFELYDLSLNAANRTDYEIEAALVEKNQARGLRRIVGSLFGRDEAGVSVRVPGTGTETDTREYLILDVADQETGLYTVILRIRDKNTGKTVETTTDLFLE